MPGNVFLELLAPLRARELLDDYWESRPLVVPGAEAKLARLAFDFEAFARAVETAPSGTVQASSVADGAGRYFAIEGREARRSFDAGMTICLTAVDRQHEALARLSADTKRALGVAGTVLSNCYLSPAGSGFGVHFDTQSVFLIQIEGSKHWRFATRPSVEFPPEALDGLPRSRLDEYRERHPGVELRDPGMAEWLEYTLLPGDILYLPPGTWHRGEAGDYSLALTLTCCTLPFAAYLQALLEARLYTAPGFRRNLPAVPGSPRNSPVPEAFVAERLAELKSFVAALTPEQFLAEWRASLKNPEP